MRISDWSSDVCSSDLAQRYADPDRARQLRLWLVTRTCGVGARRLRFSRSDRAEFRRHLLFELFQERRAAGHLEARGSAGNFRRCGEESGGIVHDRLAGAARSEEHTSELQSLMRI